MLNAVKKNIPRKLAREWPERLVEEDLSEEVLSEDLEDEVSRPASDSQVLR